MVDLEVGIVKTSAPEIRTRLLFCDRYGGVCRIGHPLLNGAGISVERWAACDHVLTSRTGAVDAALEPSDVRRKVLMVVPSYTNAMQLARRSDLLAVVPRSCLGNSFMPDYATANGLQCFELPLSIPAFNISAIWHPRLDHDPAHRWFRGELLQLCLAAYPRDSLQLPDLTAPRR